MITASPPRLLLAAAHKSSGKTTITLGICAALRRKGVQVQAFKKGPDYIDPMWLAQATGRPCYNLDFNTQSHSEITALFAEHAGNAELSLIEGNMGLFDSLDPEGNQSNAALAIALNTPVILVLDVRGATRSIVPVILGFQQFEPRLQIAGLILNKVAGKRHEQRLREVIGHYCQLPIIGCIHRDEALNIDERHLGLIPSNESLQANFLVEQIGERIASQLDLDALQQIASTAPALDIPQRSPSPVTAHAPLRIAIARDAAFGFYYPDDLEKMRQAGVELLPVDCLHDSRLPDAIDGLFIGGGFPETHMQPLAANQALRQAIHQAIEAGLPAYAECGGLMYLCRSLHWRSSQAEMVGIIPADCVMHDKPIGRGYARVQEGAAMPWPQKHDNSPYPAHEFHYSSLENLPAGLQYAYRLERGCGISQQHDGVVYKNLLASYVHQRDTASNPWTGRFIEFVRQCKQAREASGTPSWLPPFI